MRETRVDTTEDLAEGMEWLAARHDALARAYEITGPLRLRRREDGFRQLLSAIVSQQVSTASATAIWGRIEAAGLCERPSVLSASDEALRACGLSRPKVRYARALAESGIDFVALRDRADADVIAELTSVTGIGIWTAEVYAMFSLGRGDIFPSGDVALQEAARLILDLDARPTDGALREMARDWGPWRTVAACLFWQYYAVVKQREGVR